MPSPGDLATEMALKLQREHMEKVADQASTDSEAHTVMRREGRGNVFGRISFEWRDSDKATLEQIRAASWTVTEVLYDDVFQIVDNIYFEMREPEMDPKTGLVKMEDGRVVWRKDDNGKYIENFEQLTGQDIETALLDLSRVKFSLMPRVNGLLMEALFAKHIADDIRDDAYLSIVDDTIPGRTAKSNQRSRPDRYHALFRYWLYSNADVLSKEVENLRRTLDRVRERQVRSQTR
jgi:hypothetical protein